ncbi:hypothetical protein GV792_07775 [Nocardia cyriacigeorgica]|uniref:hypothetical protein n=1 Tax=Nocardia cyriacigeorgica TaxID=135487 RepID=UPI0013BD285D|nr:hypothetical protein [Nocardia cyriacigeorgica]NEW49951.1 hypothetical protein [Nocardia cyriacigeorgica]
MAILMALTLHELIYLREMAIRAGNNTAATLLDTVLDDRHCPQCPGCDCSGQLTLREK